MIKNFIFDMGNVLIDFSPDYILSQYTNDLETIRFLKQKIFYHAYWGKLDNGDISFEDACVAIKNDAPEKYHDLIDNILMTWHLHKTERKDMTELVKFIKSKGFPIYLCSNAAARFHDYKDNYEVFESFDGLLISADHLVSKPDQKIYEILMDTFNLKPEECLFIDDSIANIQAAEMFGMFGYAYNGNLERFKDFLKNVEII